jgi:FMN-dependent NADH-azoreductase
VLEHPQLGRPQIVKFAFGSSVPEIAAADVATLPIPRLGEKIENELADLMEGSSVARDRVDELETQIAHEAELLIDQFIAGDTVAFAIS